MGRTGLAVVAAATTLVATLLAAPAGAAVTVLGGGMAADCADAAFDGKSDIDSLELCSTALEMEMLTVSDRASTFVNRGVLRMRRGLLDEAINDFDTASRLKADLGEAYVNRGAAMIGQARFSEAVPQIDRGLAQGIEEPAKGYYNRGLANEGAGDLKAAYYDFRKALELRPDWDAPARELSRYTVRTAQP